jgi:hypothetical protein
MGFTDLVSDAGSSGKYPYILPSFEFELTSASAEQLAHYSKLYHRV